MSNAPNPPQIPQQKKNQYIFGGAGAVLGGLVGAGIAGPATAVVGVILGGVLGYHLLTRIGK